MAHSLTVKKTAGQPDETAIDPVNSGTATAVGQLNFMIGPPVFGAKHTQGLYAREIAGTSGQFRHLYDQAIVGNSPTVYTYVGYDN